MSDIELIDIFILILPILFINIIFSFKNSFNLKFLKSKFPFVLVSYSLLITTSIFIMLVIFHIHIIGDRLVFHIHNFHSDVITDISTFEFDFIAMLIVGWCLSIIYSSFFISQFALRLLSKYLDKLSEETSSIIEILPDETKQLLIRKNISVKMISTPEMGFIFSLSYYSLFKKNNFIFVHQSILSFYSVEELNAAIVHEIGHIYNLDTIFFPIFNTLTKLMFFDPFLRKINISYRDKMEEKADLFALQVITDPKNLAKAIVKSIEIQNDGVIEAQITNQNTSILTLKSSDKKVLTARIEKIVSFKSKIN